MNLTFSVRDAVGNVRTIDFAANVPSGAWPVNGTWTEKVDWIKSQAGVKGPRTVIGPGNIPSGCQIRSGILYIDNASLLQDITYAGQIRPSNLSSLPVTLRNVECHSVWAGSSDTRNRITLVEDCTVSMPPASATGAGTINSLVPGAVVRRSLIEGGVDGMQWSGGGQVEESVIRSLTFTSTSHNDFIQNYGGSVTMRRSYSESLNTPANRLNGIFCSEANAVYDIEDCALVVTAAPGTNGFVLHAGKTVNGVQLPGIRIDVRNSYVRGRKVGNVVFGAGVDWAAGY
jgi:hypothetical protein